MSHLADAYLSLPPRAAEELDGLIWGPWCDALETTDGRTFALIEQLEPFLGGVFSAGRPPPLMFALTVLAAMKQPATADTERLKRAFQAAKGTTVRDRNAGLLAAKLLADLPPDPNPPTWDDVLRTLTRRRRDGARHRFELAVEPPLNREAVDRHLDERLRSMSDAVLTHWFRHGCAPTGHVEIESLPARTAAVARLARSHPRLVGALVLVPALDAAVSLPPRRWQSNRLPHGGYVDVTTRGDPARLLPTQFALDADEFVRRFAANELLYFRREEPHRGLMPTRVIVLDEGVRTWGGVRLALSAAALSLLGKDPKRFGPANLILTSAGRVDPLAGPAGKLVAAIAASDLTTHPADAVRLATAAGNDSPRDIILLTHPRAIREPAVVAAMTGVRPDDRLFAVTVDDRGRCELSETTPTGRRLVRSFRVDLAAAEAATVPVEPQRLTADTQAVWTGDVEPVGFPFRPGLVLDPIELVFDAAGDWLVVRGRDGILQVLPTDGSAEVLPRTYRDGRVLTDVSAVLGLTGGVAVCGQMRLARDEMHLVVAHYRWSPRTVTFHSLGPATADPVKWMAFPDLNCVSAQPTTAANPTVPIATVGGVIDLDTGDRFPSPTREYKGLSRIGEALKRSGEYGHSLPQPVVINPSNGRPEKVPSLFINQSGWHVRGSQREWQTFQPQSDGKPLESGLVANKALLAGDVLAVAMAHRTDPRLLLLRGPAGNVSREVPVSGSEAPFTLSPDGRRVAYCRGSWMVDVAEVEDAGPTTTLSNARLHANLTCRLSDGAFQLGVRVGEFCHQFTVENGMLTHRVVMTLHRWPTASWPYSMPVTSYDPGRFPPTERTSSGPLRATVDRLGQVVLATDRRLVALFLVRRSKAAVWIPGGVFWGQPALIGGPPTPLAAERIGQALTDATGK